MEKQTFSEEVKICLQLLMDMEEACFEKDLVKSYSVDSLCRAIQQMKEYQIPCNWMFRNTGIQKEIAGNRSFIPWLSSMNLDLRYLKNLDMLLSLCQKEQIEMTQWDAGEVSSLLENNSEVTYSFLRYFYQYRDKECRETILQNIRMILETIEKEPPFDRLTAKEIEVICSPYLKYTRLDTVEQFIASIQVLSRSEGIQKVFQFAYGGRFCRAKYDPTLTRQHPNTLWTGQTAHLTVALDYPMGNYQRPTAKGGIQWRMMWYSNS